MGLYKFKDCLTCESRTRFFYFKLWPFCAAKWNVPFICLRVGTDKNTEVTKESQKQQNCKMFQARFDDRYRQVQITILAHQHRFKHNSTFKHLKMIIVVCVKIPAAGRPVKAVRVFIFLVLAAILFNEVECLDNIHMNNQGELL